ncbi:response regulator transcription factor [Granulicatella seriolae]|uniref:Response regulator transcription factor n=1 Tax=Granulicatella seriolae TaxID=2967226 RepID=A0ABT1WKF4_9LACT|nr:response regulator transcription factor [Granulicatella seriolae]
MKILYLEDDPIISEVVKEYLLLAGYSAKHAIDGRHALDLLRDNEFDLAILDIMVPYVSGLEVLQNISKTYPSTKTIMLTALGDETNQLQAFDYFADDYIIKPFSPVILLKRMEAVLRRGSPQAVSASNLGFLIQEESYQVFYRQKSLHLTVTEFLIFKSMSDYPTKAFTREELLDKIDPDNLIVSDRVIDAHIKNLRKKLPYNVIKTIIGVGYQYQEVTE